MTQKLKCFLEKNIWHTHTHTCTHKEKCHEHITHTHTHSKLRTMKPEANVFKKPLWKQKICSRLFVTIIRASCFSTNPYYKKPSAHKMMKAWKTEDLMHRPRWVPVAESVADGSIQLTIPRFQYHFWILTLKDLRNTFFLQRFNTHLFTHTRNINP